MDFDGRRLGDLSTIARHLATRRGTADSAYNDHAPMDSTSRSSFAEKRRILQLETLYDLAVSLHAQRSESELVDELIQKVCVVLDPAAAVVVTRDGYGGPRAHAGVGWTPVPDPARLLEDPVWRELLSSGHTLTVKEGTLAGRP